MHDYMLCKKFIFISFEFAAINLIECQLAIALWEREKRNPHFCILLIVLYALLCSVFISYLCMINNFNLLNLCSYDFHTSAALCHLSLKPLQFCSIPAGMTDQYCPRYPEEAESLTYI